MPAVNKGRSILRQKKSYCRPTLTLYQANTDFIFNDRRDVNCFVREYIDIMNVANWECYSLRHDVVCRIKYIREKVAVPFCCSSISKHQIAIVNRLQN